jgi:uncharacterized protein YdeI (YjbR/CyaY-like superfamily)
MTDQPSLLVPDVGAWRAWLDENETSSDGVWLVLAKKGVASQTTLRYDAALDEALCSGWIDGQVKSVDAATYLQRFTPRRSRSLWSKRNREHIARLIEEGRMRPRGLGEVERAKADGRWDAAYDGPATMQVPAELTAALTEVPGATEAFAALKGQERYAVLHRLATTKTAAARSRFITTFVQSLTASAGPEDSSR